MRVPDLVEHSVREIPRAMGGDVERDRSAGDAVHEHEDGDGDSEERQDAVEQAANDVGEHSASLTAGDGFTRRWGEAERDKITSSAARRESTNRARRGTSRRGPSPCSPSRCGFVWKSPI